MQHSAFSRCREAKKRLKFDAIETIQIIINRFSKLQQDCIEALYMENPTFQEICCHYRECLTMQDKYANDKQDPMSHRYKREYDALIVTLEEEIMTMLNKENCIAHY